MSLILDRKAFGGLGVFVKKLGENIMQVDLETGDAVMRDRQVGGPAVQRIGEPRIVKDMFTRQQMREAVTEAIEDAKRCNPRYEVPADLQSWLSAV
jgi:hypothetical protein